MCCATDGVHVGVLHKLLSLPALARVGNGNGEMNSGHTSGLAMLGAENHHAHGK